MSLMFYSVFITNVFDPVFNPNPLLTTTSLYMVGPKDFKDPKKLPGVLKAECSRT